MKIILIVLFVLALVTVVGHGIWVLLARFFRALTGGGASGTGRGKDQHPLQRFEKCPQCGRPLVPWHEHCEACGLDLDSAAAGQLKSLNVTAQQLADFRESGQLDAETFERLQSCIQARRQSLVPHREVPAPQPRASAPAEPAVPLWQELEQLLKSCEDVRSLPSSESRRALAAYRQITEERLAAMSAKAQLALARLLRSSGWMGEALRAYRRVLECYPEDSEFAKTAFEAGRLAADQQVPAQACSFLEQALSKQLPPKSRQEAERLLETLRTPAEEVILEVLPVLEEPQRKRAAPQPPAPASPPMQPPRRKSKPPVIAECHAHGITGGVDVLPGKAVGMPPAAPPPKPRRSLAELLAAFMEERNIFWGELVGGLLMVGCSIALVIYLWKDLQAHLPYFQFVIFVSTTALVFGAGLYSLYRLKLETTSRGLLTVAMLLVPLNFLVMAALSANEKADATRIATEVVSLTLFGWLMSLAARILVPGGRWPLILAVLGASASQLAVRFLGRDQTALWPFLLVACLPVASHGMGAAGLLRRLGRQPLEVKHANALFTFLGLATFSLVVALGFMVYWSADKGAALERLALPVAIAAIPILAGALLVTRAVGDWRPDTGSPPASSLQLPTSTSAGYRTAGSALALTAMLVMLGAVLMAWPQPLAMLLVCALNFAVLTAAAFVYRLPVAHAAALTCLAVAFLTAYHLVAGHLSALGESGQHLLALAAQSGGPLVSLVLLLALAAELLVRAGRQPHAVFYAAGSGLVALVSLGLVNFRGVADPQTAALVTGIYAAGSLAMNLRWRRPLVNYLGLSLVLLTTLWALWWQEQALGPLWGKVLAIEALIMAAAATWQRAALRTESSRALTQAWRDMAAVGGCLALGLGLWPFSALVPELHIVTAAALAATAFLFAWSYQAVPLTWIGSALVLGAIRDVLLRQFTGLSLLPHPDVVAVLGHATVVLAVSLGLKYLRWGPVASTVEDAGASPSIRGSIQRLFAGPLSQSAFVSSLFALPLLLVQAWGTMGALASYMGWLSGLWLIMAWTARRPLLFTAFQAALTTTVLLAVTAWLEGQEWVAGHYPDGLAEPGSLQAYGIGLGALALLWMAARLALRSHAVAQKLFEPPWPAVDRLVLALVVLAQLGLAVRGVMPEAIRELTSAGLEPQISAWPAGYRNAYGPGAWALLGVLVVVLVAALWERRQAAALLGLVILAVTVPVLWAGRFDEQLATASALRWWLATCFVLCSLPLWLRNPLARLAAHLGCPGGEGTVRPARGLLVALSMMPVLCLTAVVAGVGFSGQIPAGPLAGSFFYQIGWSASNVLPLAIVSLGLVGHALRELSAGYAFSAGLVVNVAVMGGYALGIVTSHQTLGEAEWVQLLHLGTITAALWALAWLASRPWVPAWGEGQESPLAGPLMTVQLVMSAAGNAGLLLGALGLLVFLFPARTSWTVQAGSPMGWLALVLASAAIEWRLFLRQSRLRPYTFGLIAMALLGLLACSIAAYHAEWAYRALLLGWAAFAPALVLAAWLSERVGEWESEREGAGEGKHTDARPLLRALSLSLSHSVTPEATAFWVRLAGLLVVLLGLKAAVMHQADHLWAASAIAVASSAGAAMAVWRRREDWAFTAGLGVNLAASLAVWHLHLNDPLSTWWVYLIQANVIATAVVALLWLGVRRQLYGGLELRLATGPLLATQVSLGLCCLAVLLLLACLWLFAQPGEPLPLNLLPVGYIWGWLALFLAAAASLWYGAQLAPRSRGHVLAASCLALGILAASSASLWDVHGKWLAYHVLIAAWTGTGLVILAAETIAQFQNKELEEFSSFSSLARLLDFSPSELRAWLSSIGLLVLALALRGTWEDPDKPYWSAGATLLVSALAGGVALKFRMPLYTYISGLLINLVGSMAWVAWNLPTQPYSFGYTQVVCFGLASSFWFVMGQLNDERSTLDIQPRTSFPPFSHVAATVGLCLLAVLVAFALASDVVGGGAYPEGLLPWFALGATVLALGLSLWDREAQFSLGGLYAAGLLAVGLFLHAAELEPRQLGWLAASALAGYVLLTTIPARSAPRAGELWETLHLPGRPAAWPEAWFAPVQTIVAGAVMVLSVWMVLDFASLEERLAAPAALAILIPAGILLAGSLPGRWGTGLRYATLVLGVVVLAEASWASLPYAHDGASWLHRSVLLMVSLAVMTLGYGIGLVRLLPRPSAWAKCGRRIGPVLGGLATLMLLVVLAQEGFLYEAQQQRTPMALPAIVVVAAALVGLITAAIAFAVVPGRDPFGLSERGRTLYVYAGEILLVLMFVHLRLTVPELFRLGLFVRYWPFIIMAIAFIGVGLSEFFSRRGLRVLAEPLQRTGVFLPLLPVLAFWILPHDQAAYGKHALEWFLVGSLYSLVAVTKRSFRFALFAALALNAGLWALLYRHRVDFLLHPQLWLIPLALIVLVAEQLNRDRLSEQQSGALRYLALLVIYVSSTADMFIAGLGRSVVWPLVLALLSIVGVLAGILLRVRAFLYLGVTFLFLVICTMILHAAVGQGQMWVWWVSGILLGLAIFVLFAIFEKRRQDVLRVIENIKKWD